MKLVRSVQSKVPPEGAIRRIRTSEVVDPNREKDPWNKTPTEREVRSTRVPCSVAQAHGATAEDDSPDMLIV